MKASVFFLMLLLAAPNLSAADKYILIGGGPFPEDSQISIESNVIWINRILRSHGVTSSPILFASGPGDIKDVQVHIDDKSVTPLQETLYRIYGNYAERYYDYRHNKVDGVSEAANRENVINLIQTTINNTTDTVTLIYNGHGSFEPKDTQRNALRLWDKTFLSAYDLHKLITEQPAGKKVRFILPQCYSGAFTNIIFNDGKSAHSGIKPGICGFTSVPDDRQSEGCTPYSNEYKYLDYSTYFFAALDGKTRTGQPLSTNPDSNHDGSISLREAHFYALQQAKSRDIPRSTSETFLESWEPWYLKWQTDYTPTENEYFQAFRTIAATLESSVKHTDPAYIRYINSEIIQTITSKKQLMDKMHKLETQIVSLQNILKQHIRINNPNLYIRLNQLKIAAFTDAQTDLVAELTNDPAYSQIIKLQTSLVTLEKRVLDYERQEGLLRRIARMHKLGRLQNLLYRYGNQHDIDAYNSLLSCESGGLVTP